eukprot:scaffold5312_cov118-Isochrysis_galbana.AAC.14
MAMAIAIGASISTLHHSSRRTLSLTVEMEMVPTSHPPRSRFPGPPSGRTVQKEEEGDGRMVAKAKEGARLSNDT